MEIAGAFKAVPRCGLCGFREKIGEETVRLPSGLMGYYSGSMGFYSDLMGFYSDSMGY